ncbi:MAG: hypothetical protein LBL45_02430 [Treponema sp.]|nr:hypothetical protein [Treponema sp.]
MRQLYQKCVAKHGAFSGPAQNGLFIEYTRNSGDTSIVFEQLTNTDGSNGVRLSVFNPALVKLEKQYKFNQWMAGF